MAPRFPFRHACRTDYKRREHPFDGKPDTDSSLHLFDARKLSPTPAIYPFRVCDQRSKRPGLVGWSVELLIGHLCDARSRARATTISSSKRIFCSDTARTTRLGRAKLKRGAYICDGDVCEARRGNHVSIQGARLVSAIIVRGARVVYYKLSRIARSSGEGCPG